MTETRVVLITGAGSGIGFASALEYAKAGYKVVATVRDPSKGEALNARAAALGVGASVTTALMDVTSTTSVKECVRSVEASMGAINILLLAAGAELPSSLDELDIDEGKAIMDINYWGVIRVFQAVYPGMKARKSGHVQVVSSWAGRFSNFPFFASYNPTKHALEAAFEGFYGLAKLDGITISMIEPGPVQTDIHGKFIADQEKYIKSEQRKQNFESLLYGFYLSGVTQITQSRESVAQVILDNANKSQPEFRVPTSDPVRFNISLFDPDTTGAFHVAGAEVGPSLAIPDEVKNSEGFQNFKKGIWRSDFSTWEADGQNWIEAKKVELAKAQAKPEEQ